MPEGKSAVWIDSNSHLSIKKLLLEEFTKEKLLEELAGNLINEAIEARRKEQINNGN